MLLNRYGEGLSRSTFGHLASAVQSAPPSSACKYWFYDTKVAVKGHRSLHVKGEQVLTKVIGGFSRYILASLGRSVYDVKLWRTFFNNMASRFPTADHARQVKELWDNGLRFRLANSPSVLSAAPSFLSLPDNRSSVVRGWVRVTGTVLCKTLGQVYRM